MITRKEERNRKLENIRKQQNGNSKSLPILLNITLNVNSLNSPIKIWIKKQDATIWSLEETHLYFKCKKTESEGMGKDISCKWLPKVSRSHYTYIT